jgi:hypothetical protein
LVIICGLPVTAAVGGRLLAGREPPTIARQLIEGINAPSYVATAVQ